MFAINSCCGRRQGWTKPAVGAATAPKQNQWSRVKLLTMGVAATTGPISPRIIRIADHYAMPPASSVIIQRFQPRLNSPLKSAHQKPVPDEKVHSSCGHRMALLVQELKDESPASSPLQIL